MKILASFRGDAAGYYRMRAPLSVLSKRYGIEVQVRTATASDAGEHDILWLQQSADAVAEIVVRDHKLAGGKVVYDVDDLLEEIPPTWDGYSDFFDPMTGRRRDRLEFHKRIMAMADVITCTTEALAQALAGSEFLNIDRDVIRVMPNCVMGGQWDTLPPVKREDGIEGPVVGWFGTPNHWDDLVEIAGPIGEAVEAIGGVFVVAGFPGIVAALPKELRDRTYIQELVPFRQFGRIQQSIVTFDVGIAWCTDRLKACRMRSPLKAIQYGAARVPVVASRTVYGDLPEWRVEYTDACSAWSHTEISITDLARAASGFSINGIGVSKYGMQVWNTEAVAAAIVALVNRPDMAATMARAWQDVVWSRYTYETQVERWFDLVKEIMS